MDKELKSINVPIEEFLNAFFNVNDIVNLRVFDDRKNGVFKGQKLAVEAGKFDTIRKVLQEHNAKNHGIFFVVNSGGNTDEEISRINAQFVEIDEGSFESQVEKINSFKIEPSLVVKTRKSLHCYWLTKNAKVDKFRNIQKGLVAVFNGDSACVNESRVLRLPGFYHCKEEPIKVEIVKFNPELRYTQDELMKELPIVIDDNIKTKIKEQSSRTGLNLLNRCEFIKHCKEKASTIPESEWYAMITNLALFNGGAELIHELSKSHKDYSENETNSKILHFLESKTAPMTCKAIAEKGFKCPKLNGGECGCKSPAGLAYKPYNADEIKQLLEQEKVSIDVVENVALASSFIKKNMYNIDKMIAEPMIESYLSTFFKFKGDNAKRLVNLYREINKEYLKKKEKNFDEDKEIADWYIETDRGLKLMPGILAKHLSKEHSTFYSAENFYQYENGVYKPISVNKAKNTVKQHLLDTQVTMNQINDTTSQWEIMIEKGLNELNSNAFIINCKNGLYNVLDDSFKPHTSEYLSTVQINPSYNPSAKCEVFMKYLSDCLESEEINLVQEILGYLLVPITKAQKCFVFTGVAHAGKSVLLDMITETLLGDELVSHIMWQQLGDRFKTAELFGKMANTFSDLPTENIDENSMFKAITGQDYITAEEKNKKPFSFKPYSRLVFSCNEVPKNYSDRSEGFYRRLIIIPFEKAIPIEERDADLKDKLMLEADGILNFAIKGLKRLIENKYVFSETTKTKYELERYKKESNSALIFVDERCELKPKAVSSSRELYEKYTEYCRENGLRSMSQPKFNSVILLAFPFVLRGKDNISRRVIWKGLGLNT